MSFPALFWEKIVGKKASRGFVLLLFLIYVVLDKGPAWIQALKKDKPQPPILGGETVQEGPQTLQEQSNCVSLVPFADYDVEIEHDRMKKKGEFYWPTGSGNTWEGTIWVKGRLKPSFKEMFVEYEISSEENYDKPPAFIWVLSRISNEGDRQHVAKLWVPEFTESNGTRLHQMLGFARTLDYAEGLKRDNSLGLSDPVKESQLDSLTIKQTGISGNEMMVNFIYNYTSTRTGVAFPYPFMKKIIFPFSNLASSGEILDFGLGTYVGHGLRVVSLKICY